MNVCAHGDRSGWSFEVEIAQRECPAADVLLDLPVRDCLAPLFLRLISGFEREGLVSLRTCVSAGRIGELQSVYAVLVREKVINAFLLHQSTHETEIGFAILNTVLSLAIV